MDRPYANFVTTQPAAMAALTRLRTLSEFAHFEADAVARADCGQTLDSLLIRPVQRLPRYELLLKACGHMRAKRTITDDLSICVCRICVSVLPHPMLTHSRCVRRWPWSGVYAPISCCVCVCCGLLTHVAQITGNVNEAQREAENIERLRNLARHIEGKAIVRCSGADGVAADGGGSRQAADPARRLLHEGMLAVTYQADALPQPRSVFLLSDMLLLCSKRLFGHRYDCHEEFALQLIAVRDTSAPGGASTSSHLTPFRC
jgi:hypothetical protein